MHGLSTETWSKVPQGTCMQRRKLSSGLSGMVLHQHQTSCGQGDGPKHKSSGIAQHLPPSVWLQGLLRSAVGRGGASAFVHEHSHCSCPGRGGPCLPLCHTPWLGRHLAVPCPSMSQGRFSCTCSCWVGAGAAGQAVPPWAVPAPHSWTWVGCCLPRSLCPTQEGCLPALPD